VHQERNKLFTELSELYKEKESLNAQYMAALQESLKYKASLEEA
jgi:hypothetical protein